MRRGGPGKTPGPPLVFLWNPGAASGQRPGPGQEARASMSTKRWLWCLVVGAALACRGSGEEKAHEDKAQERVSEEQRVLQERQDAGLEPIRKAPPRPDGGTPDAGASRYKLEPVGPRQPGQCAPGEFRCCDGSCSPDKRCPGISCDPVPSFKE